MTPKLGGYPKNKISSCSPYDMIPQSGLCTLRMMSKFNFENVITCYTCFNSYYNNPNIYVLRIWDQPRAIRGYPNESRKKTTMPIKPS